MTIQELSRLLGEYFEVSFRGINDRCVKMTITNHKSGNQVDLTYDPTTVTNKQIDNFIVDWLTR